LAGVALCCLGLLLSLAATAASDDVHSPFARAQEDGRANAPLPDVTYPLTLAEEVHKTDKGPVNAYFLTMLVLAVASFGGERRMAAHEERLDAGSYVLLGRQRSLVVGSSP